MNPADFPSFLSQTSASGKPFCVATVVRVDGSASAAAGAKAIVGDDGRVLFGYVGGGCVEAAVADAAVQALREGRPRVLPVELTDELGGAGVPCGGRMEIFVEPFSPAPRLVVLGHGRVAQALCALGARAGYRLTVDDPLATTAAYPDAARIVADNPDYERLEAGPDAWVVIATHHKSDHLAIARAIDRGAAGISMIASARRREAVFEVCREMGLPEEKLAAVRAPAGLDLGAGSGPEEIALSVLAEITAIRKGGSGRPLREVKSASGKSSGSGCARLL